MSAEASLQISSATHYPKGAAEHAHAVDAAARPRDRRFFETENRPEVRTDLVVAAQLMGNPLGARLPSARFSGWMAVHQRRWAYPYGQARPTACYSGAYQRRSATAALRPTWRSSGAAGSERFWHPDAAKRLS